MPSIKIEKLPLPKQINKKHTTKSYHLETTIIDILKNLISKVSLDYMHKRYVTDTVLINGVKQ